MKKFLLPIINLVNVVLCSIVYGLGSNVAFKTVKAGSKVGSENWYSLVWMNTEKGANILGIVGFFLFVFATAAILFAFIPTKARKCVNGGIGIALIAAGVLMLLSPLGGYRGTPVAYELTDSLIAMAVLVFVAGALALGMMIIEAIPEKKAK